MSLFKTKRKNKIIKLTGQEILPRGFSELEPIITKDEFQLQNHLQDKQLENLQRLSKANRRKQYIKKNKSRKRETTIYILEKKLKEMQQVLKIHFQNSQVPVD